MHTSYSLIYEHNSSLLSSGAGLSPSSEWALLAAREVGVDFVDLLPEAVAVILERIELNFDHPS